MSETEPDFIPPEETLAGLIGRVQFHYLTPIDFEATDHDNLQEIVRRLTQAAHLFNVVAITEFGGRSSKEREPGLCEQAIAAAFQICFGEEVHPDPFEKASVILRGIIGGHPFGDGNKRTGFLTAYYYLSQVGYPPTGEFPEEEVVRFCFAVSRGEIRDIGVIQEYTLDFWGYTRVEDDDEGSSDDDQPT